MSDEFDLLETNSNEKQETQPVRFHVGVIERYDGAYDQHTASNGTNRRLDVRALVHGFRRSSRVPLVWFPFLIGDMNHLLTTAKAILRPSAVVYIRNR